MNPLRVIVLVAALAFSSAQLGGPNTATTGSAPPVFSSTGGLGGSILDSLMQSANMPAGGILNSMNQNPAGAAAGPNSGPTMNNNQVNSAFDQVLTNPLMASAMTGFDNMYRAFLAPYMRRMGGNNAAFYFLNGGMDKMAPVMMSDVFSRQMSQATGMNPTLTSFFTANMFDAPDMYPLTNMLFNGMGGNQQQGGASGPLPNGAAGNTNQNGMNSNNPFGSMFSSPIGLMAMSGMM